MFYAKKLQLAAGTFMIAPGMFEQQTDPSDSLQWTHIANWLTDLSQ